MKNKNKHILTTNNTTKSTKNDNNKAITRIKDWSNYNAGMVDRGNFKKLAKLAVKTIKKEVRSRAWNHHKSAGRPKKISRRIDSHHRSLS